MNEGQRLCGFMPLILASVLLFLLNTIDLTLATAGGEFQGAPEAAAPFRHYTDIHPVESHVPFITCGVCKRAVRQLVAQVKASRKTKPSELDYLNVMKNLCDPLEDEGFWITELDIVENGQMLEVKRMNGPGHCEEDCKTVALTCKHVMDTADSEIAELLYLNKSGTTPETVCANSALKALKGACGNKVLIAPTSRPNRGSNFRPKTKADFEREQKAAEQLLYGGSSGASGGNSRRDEGDKDTQQASDQIGIMTEGEDFDPLHDAL